MFNKILYGIITIVIIISLNLLYITSHFVNKHKKIAKFIQHETLNLLPHIYSNYFNSKMYYSGEYKKTNNIDIIISNHINYIDFFPFISTIRQFDDRYIYIIMKKEVKHEYPIGGGLLQNCSILLARNYKEDEKILRELTNTISNAIIMIYPEGTTFTRIKQLKSINYSLKNKLPVMTNTLYPKMKGIYQLIYELNNQNKLGNVIDFTLIMEDMMSCDKINKMFTSSVDTYNIINSYKVPNFNNYEEFKTWFISKWYKKNNLIENYKNYKYNKVNVKYKKSYLILIFILLVITLYLLVNNPKIYIFITIIFYLIYAI